MTSRRTIALATFAACLATAAALIAAPQTPQTPQRDSRQPVSAPVGTGALGGVVTNEDGSRPVKSAYVVLIGMGTGAARVSSTDADGKFMFPALPADRYIVGASKPPYLGAIAGARRPARPGTPIVLADAQKIANVAIRMPMGAAISGVITDERGQVGSRINVTLYQWRMQRGERTLVIAGASQQTDERGRYRIFGLAPGEYVVSALNLGAGQPSIVLTTAQVDAALKSGSSPLIAPPPPATSRPAAVFFPGTTRPMDALSVTVAAGEERQNVDFKLELVATAKVEGTVVTSEGQPVTTGTVILMAAGVLGGRSGTVARITPDGRFALPNVAPGTYTAVSGGANDQFGMATVEVAGADVLGVQLTMRPLLSFSGTVMFRGAAAPPALAGWRVPLRLMTTGIPNAPGAVVEPTTETGSFNVAGVFPGAYVIGGPMSFGATAASVTWALESVVVDGRNVTDLPTTIAADAIPKSVVVTFTDRFQELSGKISRSTGAPAPEHTIIVFPEDKAYWLYGSRRILTTRPGTDGKFTLSGAGPTTLPPGKYLLAAVTDLDRDEQFDPAFLAALVSSSVPITLQPGEKKVQDLVIK